MSQSALPTTVTVGLSLIVSSFVERMCRGNRVRVQLKMVLRISHHCGFAGTSQMIMPGLLPVASASSMCRSPSASTCTATTRRESGRELQCVCVDGPGKRCAELCVMPSTVKARPAGFVRTITWIISVGVFVPQTNPCLCGRPQCVKTQARADRGKAAA